MAGSLAFAEGEALGPMERRQVERSAPAIPV